MRRIILSAFALLILAGCATTHPTVTDAPLIDAMAKRLDLSREVAWIKYRDNLPVRDAKREAEVIDRMTTLAASRGMNTAAVRKFFTAQIAASCAEQEHLIRKWKRGARLPAIPPRDLRTEVRHDIDAINLVLLDDLARTPSPHSLKASAAQILRSKGFDARVASLAAAGL